MLRFRGQVLVLQGVSVCVHELLFVVNRAEIVDRRATKFKVVVTVDPKC